MQYYYGALLDPVNNFNPRIMGRSDEKILKDVGYVGDDRLADDNGHLAFGFSERISQS